MKQVSGALIISKNKEAKKRKQLLAVIRKKRAVLKQIILKTEMLRVNLDMARQEYMVRVGSLFLKDNTLDLEIIRLRNIIKLMEEGQTYNDACEQVAKTYYAEQLKFETEKAKIAYEEEIYSKREEHKPQITNDLKKLWKKLVAKFHPDLVRDPGEKKKRTVIMKQLNKAYEEGDYDQLVKIEKDHAPNKEHTVENLEDLLLTIIKEIDAQLLIATELKRSEWYGWMIKIERAKRNSGDIFAETEKRLLNDIIGKFDLIKELKKVIQEKEELREAAVT